MDYKIYCIIDINGLKYVGKTYRTLKQRFKEHRYDKKRKHASSSNLDLDNSKIILLCKCNECDAQKYEQYFKDHIKCVNIVNPVLDKEKRKLKNKERNQLEYRKEYFKELDLFRSSKVVNGCYEFIQMLNSY